MHVHRVMVKLADPSTLAQCRALMESMRDKIDYMVELEVDVNNLDGSYSCDLCLTTTWPDLDAYQRYTRDPAHIAVRTKVLELTAVAMTLDVSVPDAEADA